MNAALRQIASVIGALVRWWLSELAGLVPARLRRSLKPDHGMLLVTAAGATARRLHIAFNGRAKEIGRIGADGPAAREELHRSLRRAGRLRELLRGDLRVGMRLPPAGALRQVVQLPLATEENLQEVVAFELERYVPFRRQDVYFAARPVQRDVNAQRLHVDLTVAPRSMIDQALHGAAALGLEPDVVEIMSDDPSEPPSGNLLPPRKEVAERRFAHGLPMLLGGVAAVLAAVALYIPLHQAQTTAAALTTQFAETKALAVETSRLQADVRSLRDDGMFLVVRKRQSASVSDLLNEVTRLLPDDTWLSELQVNGGEIRLNGESSSASALIGLMEQSQWFRGAMFRSPVVQDAAASRERFEIGARIERGAGR
jgi:general secretion pathway protein L